MLIRPLLAQLRSTRRSDHRFEGNEGGPKEGGLNIGQHEGLNESEQVTNRK